MENEKGRNAQEPQVTEQLADEERMSHTIPPSHRIDADALKAIDAMAPDVLGLESRNVATMIIEQARQVLANYVYPADAFWTRKAQEVIREFKPQNVTQGMLAAQMFACNCSIFECRRKAMSDRDNAAEWKAREIAYSRLFMEQASLLEKLQGRSARQKVVVEHVYSDQAVGALPHAVPENTHSKKQGG